MLTGTIVNALAILAGAVAGMLLKQVAGKFSASLDDASTLGLRLQTIIMQGVALCILYIGIDGCLKGENALIAILSMVLGSIIGELLDLDKRMRSLGDWVQAKTAHLALGGQSASVSEGFVTASLLFCVGAMAIMGALDSGLTGDHATLYAKSTLDGITSIVYGSTMGAGVALSGVAVFLYQGLITLCASFIAPFLSDVVIAEMKCVGSLLIIGLSFNMLGMTKIKVMNYVPAVFFPILLCTFM